MTTNAPYKPVNLALLLLVCMYVNLVSCTNSNKKVPDNQYSTLKTIFEDKEAKSPNGINFNYLDSIKNNNSLTDYDWVVWHNYNIAESIKKQKYERALASSQEGLALCKKLQNDSCIAEFYRKYGSVYYYLQRTDEALEYFKLCKEQAKQCGQWYIEASVTSNLGGVLADINPREAIDYLNEAITIRKEHGLVLDRNTLMTYRILATVYTKLKIEDDRIIQLFNQVIEGAKNLKDTNLLCSGLIFGSQYFGDHNQLEKAKTWAKEAVDLEENQGDTLSLAVSLKFYASILQKQENFKEQAQVLARVMVLEKNIYNQDLANGISNLKVAFETEQIRSELLQKKIETKEATNKLNFLIIASLAIISIGGFAYKWRINKAKQEAEKKRLEAIIDAEEREKTRIARDLHDGVVQNITAIKLGLKYVLPQADEKLTSHLMLLNNELDKTSQEVRDLSHKMMPIELKATGLYASIENLMSNTLNKAGIPSELDCSDKLKRYSDQVELGLYRIVQELINNVLKHSKATNVHVWLGQRGEYLQLLFEDNGVGIENMENQGVGLHNMRSRVNFLGGKFSVQSTKGEGTLTIVKIPI